MFVHALVFVTSSCQVVFIAAVQWLEDAHPLIEVAAAVQLSLHFGTFAFVGQQWIQIYHGLFLKGAHTVRMVSTFFPLDT